MGLPRVVSREVMRGKQGPRGLAAPDAEAWQPDTDYIEGDLVRADDGSTLYCIADHHSGSDLMDDLANWTPYEVLPDSIANTALIQEFADKSAQNEIEAGRLNPAVLSGMFGEPYITFGATEMWAPDSVDRTPIGAQVPVIWLEKDDYAMAGSFKPHRSWAKVAIKVRGLNGTAGTGNVLLRGLLTEITLGEDVLAEEVGGVKNPEAQGIRVPQDVTLAYGVEVDASKDYAVRIFRDDDALDTLADKWGLLTVEIQPTAYVTFTPELPEAPASISSSSRAFTAVDSAALDVQVWHQAPPPSDDADDEGYVYHPITDAATLQDFTTSTNTTVDKWAFVWANRWNYGNAWNKRPNYVWGPSYKVGDYECRTVFTTVDRAHMATRLQVRHLAGGAASITSDWLAVTASDNGAPGSVDDILDEADVKADLETYFTEDFTWAGVTYKVAIDKVILSTATLDEAAGDTGRGVVLDYEVGDSRTPAETEAWVEEYANELRDEGYELFLYTNPLTNFVQKYHGIDSTNLPNLLNICSDYIGVMLTSNLALEGAVPSAFNAAITRLGGPLTAEEWAKVVIVLELGVNPGTTLDDAQWVYDKLHEEGDLHPDKLMYWRFHAQLGGDITRKVNQQICISSFGTTTPPSMA